MSAAFTSGPWRLDESRRELLDDEYHAIDAGHGFHRPSDGGFCLSGFMSLADARLITAAPDLLTALERLVALTLDDDEPTLNALSSARAAIAKATGKGEN